MHLNAQQQNTHKKRRSFNAINILMIDNDDKKAKKQKKRRIFPIFLKNK